MIDFSKDADANIVAKRSAKNADVKRMKKSDERSLHINYDFENRDEPLIEKKDAAISPVIPDAAKTDKNEAAENRDKRFEKSSVIVDTSEKKTGFELTK